MRNLLLAVSALLTTSGLATPWLEAADAWNVTLRKQVSDDGKVFRAVSEMATWEKARTAIIVIDMWDNHSCKSAAARVVEMAPHMNRVLKTARSKGAFIIHAPSNCMDAYRDSPARLVATRTQQAEASTKFQWNHFDPKHEGPLDPKLEQAGCSCDSAEPCGPDKRNWTKEIPALEIHDKDAVTDNGQEIYNLLTAREIKNVVIMGVHTNRCVLGRPFGIRQMVYLGQNVVLCRDLTDSFHRDPGQHFQGLAQIVSHVEKYWCPTITSDCLSGEPPFAFAGARPSAAGR